MIERKYMAFWDDGHDTGEFEFYSFYRAKSKKNYEDACKEYINKHGYREFTRVTILKDYIYLV